MPARYRHLETLQISYARWDLSAVELVDPHDLTALCALYPLDKTANADGQRRRLDPMETIPPTIPQKTDTELPPLLHKLVAEYAATGRSTSLSPQT